MRLGAFSVSLAVKDIAASRAFYEKLGFTVFGGNQDQRWLIMKNDTALIGLFQGMFDKNVLTFNPGWDQNAQNLAAYTDVRELQKQLKARGVSIVNEADESTTGPASFVVVDPDGAGAILRAEAQRALDRLLGVPRAPTEIEIVVVEPPTGTGGHGRSPGS